MTQPFFSIVIPTRGRPKLLRDALVSTLRQDFDDFEVVASDNYNDAQTQAVFDEFKEDRPLRCVRTDRLLNMPEHWDFATQHARGEYVLILTDRSVLKQGALKTIHEAISSTNGPAEVCSWRWSLYNDSAECEYGDGSIFNESIVNFPSKKLAEEFANGLGSYVYCLPRGLNSCYKSTLMQRIRDEFGSPFRPISPDYYSAFAIMGIAHEVLFVNQSLFVSQGLKDSNGWRGMSGIDTGYIKSLGEYDIYNHVPIKSLLVKNLIFEDFLDAREVIGGNLKDVNCDWSAYFENCYRELLIKKGAGILSPDEIGELFDEWERALSTFDQATQNATKDRIEISNKSFSLQPAPKPNQECTFASSFLIRIKRWIKKVIRTPQYIGNSPDFMPDEKRRQSVLEVAGF